MTPKTNPGELPESEEGGTAAGSPVAGVTISDADACDAVKGRTTDWSTLPEIYAA